MNLKRKHVGNFLKMNGDIIALLQLLLFMTKCATKSTANYFSYWSQGFSVGIVQDSSVKVIQAYADVPLKPIRNPCEKAC